MFRSKKKVLEDIISYYNNGQSDKAIRLFQNIIVKNKKPNLKDNLRYISQSPIGILIVVFCSIILFPITMVILMYLCNSRLLLSWLYGGNDYKLTTRDRNQAIIFINMIGEHLKGFEAGSEGYQQALNDILSTFKERDVSGEGFANFLLTMPVPLCPEPNLHNTTVSSFSFNNVNINDLSLD